MLKSKMILIQVTLSGHKILVQSMARPYSLRLTRRLINLRKICPRQLIRLRATLKTISQLTRNLSRPKLRNKSRSQRRKMVSHLKESINQELTSTLRTITEMEERLIELESG